MIKICLVCKQPYIADSNKRKYCSKKCYGQNMLGKPNQAIIGKTPWNKNPQKIICKICGKEFTVSPARKNKAKYCSIECSHEAKRRVTGTTHKLWKRVQMYCELCGNMKWVKLAKVYEFRFCSRKCHGTYISKQAADYNGPTSIELAIMNELDKRDVSYKPQHVIANWLVDMALPQYRIAIECDGDYWHSSENQKQKDANKDHWLQTHKWTILRFTETDIRASPQKCVDKIISHISGIVTQRH